MFNYGLLIPAQNGKLEKFLDEGRILRSYNFSQRVELIFTPKRRVNIDSKTFQAINTKKKQKQFLEYVVKSDIDKIAKYGTNGFDPNFLTDTGGLKILK